jgi:hypothetical protein
MMPASERSNGTISVNTREIGPPTSSPEQQKRRSIRRGIPPKKPSQLLCERTKDLEMMDVETGELRNLTCQRASTCEPCALRKAYKIKTFIHEARPNYFATITQLPGDPALDLEKMQKMSRSLRKRGEEFKWAWVIEPNRHNTSTHAHCYVRAHGPVREEAWHAAASNLGVEVHIQDHCSSIGGAGYGLKSILGHDAPYGGPSRNLSSRLRHF